MTVGYQGSLFDVPPEPVLSEASGWIGGLVASPLAVSLCVIAVALFGMLLLTGRLHVRRGLQVILGCFLLLGSSGLAVEVIGFGLADRPPAQALVLPEQPANTPLPTVAADPYSGASLLPHGPAGEP